MCYRNVRYAVTVTVTGDSGGRRKYLIWRQLTKPTEHNSAISSFEFELRAYMFCVFINIIDYD